MCNCNWAVEGWIRATHFYSYFDLILSLLSCLQGYFLAFSLEKAFVARWESRLITEEGYSTGKGVCWGPSQLGAWLIVQSSFITALNTDKNKKSEKESGEKGQSHAYGSVSTACHCHRLISHSPSMQLLLSHSSSPPFGGVVNSKGLCLHAIFLRSQWNCSAVAPRWIAPSTCQTFL